LQRAAVLPHSGSLAAISAIASLASDKLSPAIVHAGCGLFGRLAAFKARQSANKLLLLEANRSLIKNERNFLAIRSHMRAF
jgi:hypothetical protein